MPGRLGPDVSALGKEILIDALSTFPVSVEVDEKLREDWTAHYPIVVGYRIPGGSSIDLRFLDRALYQVNVYDDDAARADEIAQWCRTGLFETQQYGKRFPHGSISNYSEQSAPAPIWYPGQPTGETFIPATYQLYVCP